MRVKEKLGRVTGNKIFLASETLKRKYLQAEKINFSNKLQVKKINFSNKLYRKQTLNYGLPVLDGRVGHQSSHQVSVI